MNEFGKFFFVSIAILLSYTPIYSANVFEPHTVNLIESGHCTFEGGNPILVTIPNSTLREARANILCEENTKQVPKFISMIMTKEQSIPELKKWPALVKQNASKRISSSSFAIERTARYEENMLGMKCWFASDPVAELLHKGSLTGSDLTFCTVAFACEGKDADKVPPGLACPEVTTAAEKRAGKTFCPGVIDCHRTAFPWKKAEPIGIVNSDKKESNLIVSKDREVAVPATEVKHRGPNSL